MRPAPLRQRPGRLMAMVAGTLFVALGTLLMAVHGRWWGVAAGVGGLFQLAGAWSADLRPPTSGGGRVGRPGRPEQARRRWWRVLIACLLLLVVCAVAGLIIGEPTVSFLAASMAIGQGLFLTGPGYAGRPQRERV